MSLLNEVLKDIDQRRGDSHYDRGIISIPIGINNPPEAAVSLMWYIVLPLAIIGLAYLYVSSFFVESTDTLYMDSYIPPLSTQVELKPVTYAPLSQSRPLSQLATPNYLAGNTKPKLSQPITPSATAASQANSQPAVTSPVVRQAELNQPQPPRQQPIVSDTIVSDTIVSGSPAPVRTKASNALSVESLPAAILSNNYRISDVEKTIYSARQTDPSSVTHFFNTITVNTSLLESQLLDLALIVKKYEDSNRQLWLGRLYEQLSVKSNEPGYWSFMRAIQLDKIGDSTRAAHYYENAVDSIDLSQRQRGLARLRLSQIYR